MHQNRAQPYRSGLFSRRAEPLWPRCNGSITTALLALLLAAPVATAQQTHLLHPEPLETGAMVVSPGASVTILPRTLVETEIRQAPLLDVRARIGLPVQFSVEGGVRTNVITNFVDLRGRYAFDFDPVTLGASLRLGWWYGFAPFEGFDISATSWLNYPGVELGFRIDDVRFGALFEIQHVTFLSISTDEVETTRSTNEIGGYSLHLFTEQPFWGETPMSLSLRLHYAQSLYQAWLAFSSSEEYLLYPEVTLGILL